MLSSIYLDNNATTLLDPLVAAKTAELQAQVIANPASQHRYGRAALALLEDAKTELLQWVGAPCLGMNTAQIVLTSGGTEANNLAIHSLSLARPGLVVVGATEHPSILDAAQNPTLSSNPVRILPVDQHGRHDLARLAQWSEEEPIACVSVMLGNNETGVLSDLSEICRICHDREIPVHCDVIQAVGKLAVNMSELGLAAMTMTAHKLHGPVGIGALIARRDISLNPVLIGGGQQLGVRAGTEPVIPTVAFAAALRVVNEARIAGVYQAVGARRDRFERAMLELGGTEVVGSGAPRLPHTSNISFVDIERQALQIALDLAGLACSAGSACSSGSSRPSPILLAMGLPEAVIKGSLRFSLSKFTTDEEVDSAIDIIRRVVARLRH
jgi:cysteine desulfurase